MLSTTLQTLAFLQPLKRPRTLLYCTLTSALLVWSRRCPLIVQRPVRHCCLQRCTASSWRHTSRTLRRSTDSSMPLRPSLQSSGKQTGPCAGSKGASRVLSSLVIIVTPCPQSIVPQTLLVSRVLRCTGWVLTVSCVCAAQHALQSAWWLLLRWRASSSLAGMDLSGWQPSSCYCAGVCVR